MDSKHYAASSGGVHATPMPQHPEAERDLHPAEIGANLPACDARAKQIAQAVGAAEEAAEAWEAEHIEDGGGD